MRTLADFKRALTLGSKWKTHYHPLHEYWGKGEVVKVTGKAVAFKREGLASHSWLDFPPATHIRFNDEGGVEIYAIKYNNNEPTKELGELILTYTKAVA